MVGHLLVRFPNSLHFTSGSGNLTRHLQTDILGLLKVTNIRSAWSRTAPHFGIIFLCGAQHRGARLAAGDLRNPEWM